MSLGEDEIVAWFQRQSTTPSSRLPIGIGDDMAQVRISDDTSVFITTDMLLDGVHFDLQEVTLEQVGYKAMAVSLSDCAAMATMPLAAVVSVALPPGFGHQHLKQLHAGIRSAGDRFGCALVGGDITSYHTLEPFVINVAMLAKQGDNEPVKRSGARTGDAICVTGSLGGARSGKHLEFVPRVFEAMKIARMVTVNAMIDISDGLSSDLGRICHSSGVGAVIDQDKIPVSEQARKIDSPVTAALDDGEDFELLFTLSEPDCQKLLQNWHAPLPITRIGVITNTNKMQMKRANGQLIRLEPGGYDHLRK
jgi:thiamine-monophosphate kinase